MNGWPGVVADLVDRGDVWMIERAGGARLPQQAGRGFGIADRVRRQELERDASFQIRILGQIHRAHPACADVADDPVMGDAGADHGVGCYSSNLSIMVKQISGERSNSAKRRLITRCRQDSRRERAARPRAECRSVGLISSVVTDM